MKVVILRQNTGIVSDYNPKIKFKKAPEPWTARFVSFTLQRPEFDKMYKYLSERGVNPYSVLAW